MTSATKAVLAGGLFYHLPKWLNASWRSLDCAKAAPGEPEIVNTDQGAQFTGLAFTGLLT